MSLPAVSTRINYLRDSTGTKLLRRTSHRTIKKASARAGYS
ncbi:MAG: hypothetical protein K8F51_12525 [Comamonas sp.]|nr:hypothetical protein [Comamonas sp.]